MKARLRPREFEAVKMTNGNWLVTESTGAREVYRPEDFDKLFELVLPTTKRGTCGALAFGKCGHNNPVTEA